MPFMWRHAGANPHADAATPATATSHNLPSYDAMLSKRLLARIATPTCSNFFAPPTTLSSSIRMASTTAASATATSSQPRGVWRNTELSSVRYGPGCLSGALNKALNEDLSGRMRALIVTGKSLNTKTDVIAKVKAALGDKYVDTLDEIGQHAPVEAIHKAVELVQSKRIDVLVSVGGGSPIDSSKAISYYVHEKTHGKDDDDVRNYIPSIAIPTTLSVAETTQNAGFTQDKKKTGVSHAALVPRVLILDAELTLSTPERLWLSSGMRAVDHAIEALYRPGDFNHLLRYTYLGALRELFPLLRASKASPSDVELRQRLQLAVIASLFPEARKGALGLSHGLGHALGSTYSIPHGITSCLTLAASIAYTAKLESTPRGLLANLAEALPYIDPAKHPLSATPPTLDTKISTDELRNRGIAVAQEVDKLVRDLGLATSLKEWKVPEADYETIAKHVTPKSPEQTGGVVKLLQSISGGEGAAAL